MPRLVDSQWMVHGQLPLWLLLPILVAGVALVTRWLRAERRNGWAGRAVLVTGPLLLLLCLHLAWQPTLVRIDRWEHQADTLVFLDQSASMNAPLTGSDLTRQLDLLPFSGHPLPGQREVSAQALAQIIQSHLMPLEHLQEQLQAAAYELLEGVPPGSVSAQQLDQYAALVGTAREAAYPAVTQVQKVGSSEQLAASLTHFVECLDSIPATVDRSDESALASAAAALASWVDSAQQLAPQLIALQRTHDQQYLAEHESILSPALEDVRSRTRLDAARQVLGSLADQAVSQDELGLRTDETDLYLAIDRLLEQHSDSVVRQLVVVSDGGHNAGPGQSQALAALAKQKIELTVVGVGAADDSTDLAILDWRLPAVAQSRSELTMRVKLKTGSTSGQVELVLTGQEQTLAQVTVNTQGQGSEWFSLPIVAPETGRHPLTLTISTSDANPSNNRVQFSIDTVSRPPSAVLIGSEPDWDSAYLVRALQSAGIEIRQLFHGLSDEPPRRGGSPRAIPKTLSHWSRQQLVILQGDTFADFDLEDAQTLVDFVTQSGGTLWMIADSEHGYLQQLGPLLNLEPAQNQRASSSRLRIAESGLHLPMMRLAEDGPSSARAIAELNNADHAWRVPEQHATLLENDVGDPLVSLGFYGRGKIILWGVRRLDLLGEYEQAQLLSRLLEQIAADAVRPVFAEEEQKIATYPDMPSVGHPNWVLTTLTDAGSVQIEGQDQPTSLQQNVGGRWAMLIPHQRGSMQLQIGDTSTQVTAAANPGLEQMHSEFNVAELDQLARLGGGHYLPMQEAQPILGTLDAGTWQSQTATRYSLASSLWLMILIALVAAAHWSFRKIAGLAI